MKHIRKFENSREYSEDTKSYLIDCFIDFIDDGYLEENEIEYDSSSNVYLISIGMPNVYYDNGWHFNSSDKIEEIISYSKEITKFYSNIEESISKVKVKFKNATTIINSEIVSGIININNITRDQKFIGYVVLEISLN